MTKQNLLFDSTVLVDLYRGQPAVRSYLDSVLDGRIAAHLSVITEAELWRGLRVDETERHEALLSLFVRLPLQSAAARQAGAWMQRYGSFGLGWVDAFIVATARQAGLAVLTRDHRLIRCLHAEADFCEYSL